MKEPLSNKVAMVMGASQGIGRAIALKLAKEGAAVMLAARTTELLAQVQREIEDAGGRADWLAVDLRETGAPSALVEKTVEKWSGIGFVAGDLVKAMSAVFPATRSTAEHSNFLVTIRPRPTARVQICRYCLDFPAHAKDEVAEDTPSTSGENAVLCVLMKDNQNPARVRNGVITIMLQAEAPFRSGTIFQRPCHKKKQERKPNSAEMKAIRNLVQFARDLGR